MRVFAESLEAESPVLNVDQQVGKVLCTICKSQLSTLREGRSDMLQHVKKGKHATTAETKSYSEK
jgi:hypothetical protein